MATNIIDPNDAIASQSLVNLGLNAAPDYSDMFIFAELTARRRTASILSTNGVGKPTTLDNANEAVKINMMGFDQETGQYTTKWTENIGSGNVPDEGFGITQIKMTTNSSYVPQVDIEFVDLRGLSLITLGSKSKYSVIYSFPPPVFTLTIKGYYGKAISYDLHLVKQSTRFDATSGNYYINANFVAQKFAPLTDVLFKYIDVVPLMDSGFNLSGGTNGVEFNYNEPPKNTRELITRTKKLYDDIDRFKVDSQESSELNTLKSDYTKGQILLSSLNTYKSIITSDLQKNFDRYIGNKTQWYGTDTGSNMSSNDSTTFKKMERLAEYDEVVKNMSPNQIDTNSMTQRFYILYEYAEMINGSQDNILSGDKLKQITDTIINLRKSLLNQGRDFNSKIPDSSITLHIDPTKPIGPFNGKKYLGIDLSAFYAQIKQEITAKEQEYKTNYNIFKEKINDIAVKDLGSLPSIKNVFKVICDDVEVFFDKLRSTCKEAETEHVNYFERIVNNNNTNNEFISAFPLILKPTQVPDPVDASKIINRTERAYPGDESLGFTDVYFPEVNFVEDFITTFLNIIREEQIANLKESVDEDGNNKWLPNNPLDSVVNGRLYAESPYKGALKIIGSGNEKSVLSEFINRLYITSQYSYGFLFYEADGAALKDLVEFFGFNIENKNDKLIKYLARAEATNLVNSIVDPILLNSLQTQVDNWSKNIDGFYAELKSSVPAYSTLQNSDEYGTYVLLNGQKITKNRSNPDYKGFELLLQPPKLRNTSNIGTANESDGQVNIVDEFIDEVGNSGFLNNLFFDDHNFDTFTNQNIAYIKDEASTDDDGKQYDSDFIRNANFLSDNTALDYMSYALSRYDTLITTLLNDVDISDNVKLFFIVKYLCGAATYYETINDVNQKFAFPAVIEVPTLAHLNMGAYLYFYKSGATNTSIQNEISIYQTKYGSKFGGTPLFETNDKYADYIQFVSNNDSKLLYDYFVNYVQSTTENGFTNLKLRMNSLVSEVLALNIYERDYDKKYGEYSKRLSDDELNPTTESNYDDILIKLVLKLYLLNYTQVTFNPTNVTDDPALRLNEFVPLENINTTSTRNRQINDNYFIRFFSEVSRLCDEKKESLNKIEQGFRQSIEDNDLKNQTYYSFKAVADKWVMGLDDTFSFGRQKPLIEEFAFVDRFFNDIGDKVMIDFRPIIELSQDYDISVYSVMTKILALNGFEFFPVQNFLSFQQDEWINSFRTYGSSRSVIKSQTPAFICMYIGGTSSHLFDPLSGYEDDGVPTDDALEALPDYNVDQVRGFKVNFAKQNQSMFTGIELNTNEHKETNESLAILSEIAQDQSAASPVPKGQNLFSTYEQRSYTCKVDGLGNALIQPTQYFILENVPMFNGAYLILSVEHLLTPNTMKTSFEGTRIRTNPNPLVTSFSTATGTIAGDSNSITGGLANQAYVSSTDGVNRNNPNRTYSTGFAGSSAFPVNPPVTKDMTGRLISPNS